MERQARKKLENTFKLRALFEGANRIFLAERARVAELFDAELVRVRLVITLALSKSEGMVNEAMCHAQNSFLVRDLLMRSFQPLEARLTGLWIRCLYDLFFR